MASNNGHSEKSHSSQLPDETIRRFLLGSLSEPEQLAFEQQLMTDRNLAGRVQLTEFELADDYAYDRLSSTERQLFSDSFLLTADRERKLKVSQSLRDHFTPVTITNAGPARRMAIYVEKLKSILSVTQPAWRFAFATVIFIILVGTVWVVVKDDRIKEDIKRGYEVLRHPRRASTRREASHPPNTSTPEHEPAPPSTAVHEQTAPSPVITTVAPKPAISSPGSPATEAPSVNLPKGDQDKLRLQLTLDSNQPDRYRVELLTADGQTVHSAEFVKPSDSAGRQLDFDVPARLLKAGNYQIRLVQENAGGVQNTRNYYFRVQ
jgi:hypothetical protein